MWINLCTTTTHASAPVQMTQFPQSCHQLQKRKQTVFINFHLSGQQQCWEMEINIEESELDKGLIPFPFTLIQISTHPPQQCMGVKRDFVLCLCVALEMDTMSTYNFEWPLEADLHLKNPWWSPDLLATQTKGQTWPLSWDPKSETRPICNFKEPSPGV